MCDRCVCMVIGHWAGHGVGRMQFAGIISWQAWLHNEVQRHHILAHPIGSHSSACCVPHCALSAHTIKYFEIELQVLL